MIYGKSQEQGWPKPRWMNRNWWQKTARERFKIRRNAAAPRQNQLFCGGEQHVQTKSQSEYNLYSVPLHLTGGWVIHSPWSQNVDFITEVVCIELIADKLPSERGEKRSGGPVAADNGGTPDNTESVNIEWSVICDTILVSNKLPIIWRFKLRALCSRAARQ